MSIKETPKGNTLGDNDLEKTEIAASTGASTSCVHETPKTPLLSIATDPDLATVVEAWANLPDAIKAGILAMVNAFLVTD